MNQIDMYNENYIRHKFNYKFFLLSFDNIIKIIIKEYTHIVCPDY